MQLLWGLQNIDLITKKDELLQIISKKIDKMQKYAGQCMKYTL